MTKEQRNAKARVRYRERYKDKLKKYRDSRKHLRKDYDLKRDFGISLDEYNKKLAIQNGVCFICHKPEKVLDRNGNTRRLCVDHNHKTKEVRKLLCVGCNTALGYLEENADRARALAEYIDLYNQSVGLPTN